MKRWGEVTAFLDGARFSAVLEVPIRCGTSRDRFAILSELARGRRVIDLGCADHLPLIVDKRARRAWLHSWIVGAARRCIGIDIDATAIAALQEVGEPDVFVADITRPVPEIAAEHWDLIIAGEILEHIDDPVAFLKAIREQHGGRIGKIAISVPNGFALANFIGALGRETINSDHRYWFTPYTLAKVLVRAGLTPEWFTFCDPFPLPPSWTPKRGIRTALYRAIPALRKGLIMVGRF